MLLGASAGPAGAPARCAGQLAARPSRPSTCPSTARPLPELGTAQHPRRRGTPVCTPPAALPSKPRKRRQSESGREREQRLAAHEAQERACDLLLEQVEAVAGAATAPQAAKAAVHKALQPWWSAAAGAGAEAAERLECLRAETDALAESLAVALCGDPELDAGSLTSGWDSLLALQRSWAAAFPTPPATGLASTVMAALLDSLLVGRARQAGQRAARQAEDSEEGAAALRGVKAAYGTTALLRPTAQVRLESEVTCVEWVAATTARERAWVDGRCAALQAEAARWEAAAKAALQGDSEKEAGEALACAQACDVAAKRLTAASMALSSARSSLADSRAALPLMAAEARMASGLSELSRLRVAITATLASIVQDGPRTDSDGTVAPTLRLRVWDVAAAAAAGAVVLQEMREAVASGQGGPEAGADLAAAEAKAAAAADMLAASAGVEWAAVDESAT